MALPTPETGLVIRFNYLWRRERERRLEHARYLRPCAIVLAHRRGGDEDLLVVVAPITHSPPAANDAALAIPDAVRRHLGLDDQPCWVILDEVNEFVWPGFDLAPDENGQIAYGVLPDRFFQKVRGGLLESIERARLGRIPR